MRFILHESCFFPKDLAMFIWHNSLVNYMFLLIVDRSLDLCLNKKWFLYCSLRSTHNYYNFEVSYLCIHHDIFDSLGS